VKKIIFIGMLLLLYLSVSGCAHYVEFKSPDAYQYDSTIPVKVAFYMDKSLKDKMYYGRAASSGIANRWDVPVGKTVHEYAISYLKNGFTSFNEIDSTVQSSGYDFLIKLSDINYYMEGQAAHCDLTFSVEDLTGKGVFNKKYHSDGPSGYGRVLAGGAFAQKSAIRQSTNVVLETIFKNLVSDIQVNYNSWK